MKFHRNLRKPTEIDEKIVNKALDPVEIIKSRKVVGGPAPDIVKDSIKDLKNLLMKVFLPNHYS